VEPLAEPIAGNPLIWLVMGSASRLHPSYAMAVFCQALAKLFLMFINHRLALMIFHLLTNESDTFNKAQVGNEIKNNKIGKQPVKNKKDLGKRIFAELKSLQHCTERVKSFFELSTTNYVLANVG
jgi:hypothetical protein